MKEKKYFTQNKWRLAQVAADYSTEGKKYYIKARNPIFFLISCQNLLSLNLLTIVSSKLASEVLL